MALEYISIFIGGLLTLLMVVFHISFYKIFKWKNEFNKISILNKKVIYSVHIALILVFAILTYISFFNSVELLNKSKLSTTLLISFSLFWFWRTVWQLIFFKKLKNDTNKKPRPLHIFLVLWFLILTLVYLIPVIILNI